MFARLQAEERVEDGKLELDEDEDNVDVASEEDEEDEDDDDDDDERNSRATGRTEEDEAADIEAALLKQLKYLHQQLAEVRRDAEDENGLVPDKNKLIVCTLNKVVDMHHSPSGDGWTYSEPMGPLKCAINSIVREKKVNAKWISWPGAYVDEPSQDGVRNKLESEYNCMPVFLSNEHIEIFNHKFCSALLYPLFHSLPQRSDPGFFNNFMEQYESYCAVNQQFLEAVAEIYEQGEFTAPSVVVDPDVYEY
jgi:hypothetical protein